MKIADLLPFLLCILIGFGYTVLLINGASDDIRMVL